jgi:hypothetical protein
MRCCLCVIFLPLLYPASKILNLIWMMHKRISSLRHRRTGAAPP